MNTHILTCINTHLQIYDEEKNLDEFYPNVDAKAIPRLGNRYNKVSQETLKSTEVYDIKYNSPTFNEIISKHTKFSILNIFEAENFKRFTFTALRTIKYKFKFQLTW